MHGARKVDRTDEASVIGFVGLQFYFSVVGLLFLPYYKAELFNGLVLSFFAYFARLRYKV